jgi:hypothetical protein
MRSWMSVVAIAALMLPAAACSRTTAACELPAITDSYRGTDRTLAFTLPDTGGFSVNGQAIERDRIGPFLQEFFASRPPNTRAIVVWRPSAARCADVAYIADQARANGGAAFDAARSGWPTPGPPDMGRQ